MMKFIINAVFFLLNADFVFKNIKNFCLKSLIKSNISMLFSFCISFVLTNFVFFIGLASLIFTLRGNFFLIISIETMFLAINLNYMFFSIYLNSIDGLLFILFIMMVSAVEIVIFLSFFVIYYKKLYLLDSFESFNYLKQ